MRWAALTVVLVGASASGVALWLRPRASDLVPVSGRAPEVEALDAQLRETLEVQQERIDRLERKISLLDRRVRELAEAESGEDAASAATSRAVVIRGFRRVDSAGLMEAGLDPADAVDLRRLIDDAYAVHAREQSRYTDEDRVVTENLRDKITRQLGDHAYDAYLYATGQRNRLVVARVIESSAAYAAGIRTGDVLFSLDGRRVYSHRDLQAIDPTTDSHPIELEVVREDGRRVRARVPRGHLGLVTVPERSRPSASE